MYRNTKNIDNQKPSHVTQTLINKIVDKLPIKDMGPYRIYMDNWYGSLELAEDLQTKGVYFTIGCRANRPSFLFAEGLHKELNDDLELKELG